MQLTTQRLILTPISKDDSDRFYNLNIKPEVRQYLWDDEVIPLSLSNDIIKTSIDHFKEENWGLWKIKTQNNLFIGYCGLWHFFEEAQPQLLYVIDPEFAKNGYAKEASQTVISYAFDKLKFDYITASMNEANLASIKVCESLGMKKIETQIIDGNPIVFYKLNQSTSSDSSQTPWKY